jgi:ABC-type phosphonate transport system ATPase subunit
MATTTSGIIGQVDADDVALPDPLRLERPGELLHVVEELGVGQVAFLALLALRVHGGVGHLSPASEASGWRELLDLQELPEAVT